MAPETRERRTFQKPLALTGLLALLTAAALLALVPAAADPGLTTRVSVDSAGNQQGAGGSSLWSAISGDGRFVAFTSVASNLVPGDTNIKSDTFVHDRLTGATTRISVSSLGTQGNEQSGPGPSAISGDGRFVAFESWATNLVTNDTNRSSDVFVRDRMGPLPVPCRGLPANIVGSAGNDVLTGAAGPDVIAGLGGNDSIDGLGDGDVICGGDGNDTMNGGDGNDRLIGGNGDDAMDGGTEVDICADGPQVLGDTAANCELVLGVP